MYKLEDRVLFDAALPVDIVDVEDTSVEDIQELESGDTSEDAFVSEGDTAADDNTAIADALETITDFSQEPVLELVIIDTTVPEYQNLIDSLPHGTQVALVSPEDGLSSISSYLCEYENLDAVHIISHGSEADISIGSDRINSETIVELSSEFSKWNESLADGADILFYGCNVADSGEGQTLLTEIASLTQTDVAASDDITGGCGDWYLEFSTGDIEADVLNITDYAYNLNDHIINLHELSMLDSDNDGQLDAIQNNDTLIFHDSEGEVARGVVTIVTDSDGDQDLQVILDTTMVLDEAISINGDVDNDGDTDLIFDLSAGSTISVDAGAARVTLEDIVVQNQTAANDSLAIENGDVALDGIVIRNHQGSDGAIKVFNESDLHINDCTFENIIHEAVKHHGTGEVSIENSHFDGARSAIRNQSTGVLAFDETNTYSNLNQLVFANTTAVDVHYTVTTTEFSGSGSLAEGLALVNQGGGTISFDSSVFDSGDGLETIAVSGFVSLDEAITINGDATGNGVADVALVLGGYSIQVNAVDTDVVLSNITLQDRTGAGDSITLSNGNLTLDSVSVLNHQGSDRAVRVSNDSNLYISDSQFTTAKYEMVVLENGASGEIIIGTTDFDGGRAAIRNHGGTGTITLLETNTYSNFSQGAVIDTSDPVDLRYKVTTTNSVGAGSISEAISYVSEAGGTILFDSVVFNGADGNLETISVGNSVTFSKNIVIEGDANGDGIGDVAFDFAGNRQFKIDASDQTLTLNHLALTGSTNGGGVVAASAGTLAMNSVLIDNCINYGGTLQFSGAADGELSDVTILNSKYNSDNKGDAIILAAAHSGALAIADSTFVNNRWSIRTYNGSTSTTTVSDSIFISNNRIFKPQGASVSMDGVTHSADLAGDYLKKVEVDIVLDDAVGTTQYEDYLDNGGFSLREAIHWVENGGVITLDKGAFNAGPGGVGTIQLTADLDYAGKSLSVIGDCDGDNSSDLIIDGGGLYDSVGMANLDSEYIVHTNLQTHTITVDDLLTNDTTPVISGTAILGAGQALSVSINGARYDNVAVDGEGNWSVDLQNAVVGSGSLGSFTDGSRYDVTTTIVDGTSEFLETVEDTVVIDTESPAITPQVESIVSNSQTPVISGSATLGHGESLSITFNGAVYENVRVTDGIWSIDTSSATPKTGTVLAAFVTGNSYDIIAEVSDAAGNTNRDQTSTEFKFDTTVPDVAVFDSFVTENVQPVIQGTAEQGASVTVEIDGKLVDTVAADSVTGEWSLQSPIISVGLHNIAITVVDAASNSSELTSTFEIISVESGDSVEPTTETTIKTGSEYVIPQIITAGTADTAVPVSTEIPSVSLSSVSTGHDTTISGREQTLQTEFIQNQITDNSIVNRSGSDDVLTGQESNAVRLEILLQSFEDRPIAVGELQNLIDNVDLKQFDENDDGVLDEDELKKMREGLLNADAPLTSILNNSDHALAQWSGTERVFLSPFDMALTEFVNAL